MLKKNCQTDFFRKLKCMNIFDLKGKIKIYDFLFVCFIDASIQGAGNRLSEKIK